MFDDGDHRDLTEYLLFNEYHWKNFCSYNLYMYEAYLSFKCFHDLLYILILLSYSFVDMDSTIFLERMFEIALLVRF